MTTTIACGQFEAVPADSAANLALVRGQAREASSRGAALVVFPELALTGYLPAGELGRAAVGRGGPEMGEVRAIARECGIAVALGFPERAADGRLYDAMAFVDAEGSLRSVYRKVHLFGAEGDWATAGKGFESFPWAGIRAGMWICYDTRFPEAARTLAVSGATLCLASTAWFGPPDEWELALRARAMDNGIFAAGAALQGKALGLPLRGASAIVDPHGRLVAQAREGEAAVISAAYDDAGIASFRARLPLLAHRRPDAYA